MFDWALSAPSIREYPTCSKLTMETLEQGLKFVHNKDNNDVVRVFIANFEHISHLVLVFLLLTLSR